MSRQHFKGQAYAFGRWMQQAADEIASGKSAGAKILHREPNRKIVEIPRWARLLRRVK